MINESREPELHEDFAEVFSHLDRIRDRINAARYPGFAWSPPAKHYRRWLWIGASGAAATAAAILIAIAVFRQVPLAQPVAPKYIAQPTGQTGLSIHLDVGEEIELPTSVSFTMDAPSPTIPDMKQIVTATSLRYYVPSLCIPRLD